MGHTLGAVVVSDDVAAIIDPADKCYSSTGKINGAELAPAQPKAMVHAGTGVRAYDVAAPVDPLGNGGGGAGKINRSEGCFVIVFSGRSSLNTDA